MANLITNCNQDLEVCLEHFFKKSKRSRAQENNQKSNKNLKVSKKYENQKKIRESRKIKEINNLAHQLLSDLALAKTAYAVF